MIINIKGGTRSEGSPPLCDSCKHAVVVKGAADSQVLRRCTELGKNIRFPVVECSVYEDKKTLTLHQMKEMATIIVKKKGSGTVGFQPYFDWRKENDRAELLPGHDDWF